MYKRRQKCPDMSLHCTAHSVCVLKAMKLWCFAFITSAAFFSRRQSFQPVWLWGIVCAVWWIAAFKSALIIMFLAQLRSRQTVGCVYQSLATACSTVWVRLCDRPDRPRYVSCPSVRPSVCLSVRLSGRLSHTCSELENWHAHKNQNWCERPPSQE